MADLRLTHHHLALVREARAELQCAIKEHATPAYRDAWISAAERLAVALIARLESLGEDRP